jgi:hypothetical protein
MTLAVKRPERCKAHAFEKAAENSHKVCFNIDSISTIYD